MLTAELAVAYVDGVQGTGVGACIKHLVANEQETERMKISAEVSERVLRELQLAPFEAAVKRSRVAAVMSAYNKVNGTWCGEHRWLLTEVLRDEWGFDGIVISDWFGAHSAEGVTAGLDLEMPGKPRHLGKRLLAAVDEGRVAAADIDLAATRLLAVRDRLGVTDGPELKESSADDPDHRALAHEAAARSIVLLTNPSGLLPLDLASLGRVAVIGPNADDPQLQGGGSARVNPHRTVTFLEGLADRVGPATEIVHESGGIAYPGTAVVDSRWLDPGPDAPANRPFGLMLDFYLADAPDAVVHREVAVRPSTMWLLPPADVLGLDPWRCRGTATFRPPASGVWELGITSVGPAQLVLDGEVLVDSTDAEPGGSHYGMGGHEVTATVDLEAGTDHHVELRYEAAGGGMAGFAITARPPIPTDAFERAVAAAAAADVAIVVVGSTTDWETEGKDRSTMDLPGRQAELISAVAAANPRTVVVLNVGAPVTTHWSSEVGATLVAWLPGQEAGEALADVLFGQVDPSGRLPTSFPVRVTDNLADAGFPGVEGHLPYGEGLLLGYR
ncbi:MAG TPA: glycoside hydrolase family 3 C-terminal domain-containing protein, partial [Acidimicrobiales bacterium]